MIHLHWFIIAQVLGESNRIINFPVILPKDSFITIMKESMSFHTATSVLEIEKLLKLKQNLKYIVSGNRNGWKAISRSKPRVIYINITTFT